MTAEYSNYILKYTFFSNDFGGIVSIIGDTEKEEILKIDYLIFGKSKVWEKFNSDLSSMGLEEIYSTINENRESIENTIWYDQNLIMKNYFGKYPSGKLKRINNIILSTGDESLRKILIKNVFDEDIKNIFHIEGFSSEIYEEIIFHRNVQKKIEEEDDILTDKIFLETAPQIDPSNGVRAADINSENEIFVKITDSSSIGKHFSEMLSNSEEENDWLKVPVVDKETIKIAKYRESSDMCDIFVLLSDDVYGKFTVQPDIRIKIYNEIFEKEENENIKDINNDAELMKLRSVNIETEDNNDTEIIKENKEDINSFFIVGIVIFIIIFFLFIIIIFGK